MQIVFLILFLATSSVSGRKSGHHSSHGSSHSHGSHHGSFSSHHGSYSSHHGSSSTHHDSSSTHHDSSSTHHGYPASSGYSGHGSGGVHTYSASSGTSGNTYSGNHLSQPQHHSAVHSYYSPKTEMHHHYHYSPPHQISYGSTFHPVYQGHPPVYVYEYRNSGSRFDNLLTGLALYNLGRNSHYHSSERQYSSTSGEICKLGISKRNGEYEETRIDCNLIELHLGGHDERRTE